MTLLIPLVCRVSNGNSATLVVTSTSDSGAGSLRQTIAGALPGDTIEFQLTYPATISLTSGELQLNKNLTISGPGARNLTVSGSNSSRVFNNTSSVTVSLERMTISSGAAASGGGIATSRMSLFKLSNLTITGNSASSGGGIYNGGTMQIFRSTINNNSNPGTSGFGGGIYNGITGTLEISESTIHTNSATNGGAIYNYNILRCSSTTVTLNSTSSTSSAAIDNTAVTASEISIINTIISDNTGNDLSGIPTRAHYNLIKTPPASLGADSIGNITGISALLGPPANNGGPTDTCALLPGSPAINAAELKYCSVLDQRGISRIRSGGCDIGSYEVAMPLSLTATGYAVSTLSGLAGSFGAVDGAAAIARFNEPMAVATDGTYLYVADRKNSLIRRVLISTGAVNTLAGSGTAGFADGIGTAASFSQPDSLALVPEATGLKLYVADTANNRIRAIDIATGTVSTLAGSGSPASIDGEGIGASFDQPAGITWTPDGLMVTEIGSHRIRKIVNAMVTTFAGSSWGYLDGAASTAQFNNPYGLAADLDNLYVADNGNNRIRKVSLANGAVTTLAGGGLAGETDGTGTAAEFSMPVSLLLDGGDLYVSDFSGQTLRKVDLATSQVTTIAGSPLFAGAADGPGSTALFNYPAGLGSDGIRLFIADSTNHTIRSMADTIPPTDGILSAVPAGSNRIDLTWTVATDAGSGLGKTNTYKLVRAAGAAAPADCSGNPIYQGNAITYPDTGVVSSTKYSYRVCATDVAGNVSSGAVAMAATPSAITISPASYAFADQQVGTSSSPVSFMVSNSSISMPVSITPSITGTAAADFILNASGCGSVPPYFLMYGASCTITVAFAPSTGSVALRNASFNVQTNENGSPVITSPLSGSAVISISASSGIEGAISPAGTVVVPAGSNQVYTLTPNAGYHVADLLVDGVSVGAVTGYTFSNITVNHIIFASFTINTYSVTATAGANGSVAPVGATTVNNGSSQTYTITPVTGYHVADVLVDGVSVGAVSSYTFSNVTAGHSISASFALNTHTITATAGANGTISPPGATTVNYGSGQTYTISPAAGYHIVDVKVDGTSVGAVSSYTFSNVTAGHTIAAVFALPDGILIPRTGKVEPELADAIKALRISAGIEQATQEEMSRGDVAPLVNGIPQPDKKITLGDAVVILRRVVGLVTW